MRVAYFSRMSLRELGALCSASLLDVWGFGLFGMSFMDYIVFWVFGILESVLN
jgi:hypothetical protein